MNNEQTEERKHKQMTLFVSMNISDSMFKDVARGGGYVLKIEPSFGLNELYTELIVNRARKDREVESHITNQGVIRRLNELGIDINRKMKPKHLSLGPDDLLYVVSSIDQDQLRCYGGPEDPPLPASVRLYATKYYWKKDLDPRPNCKECR